MTVLTNRLNTETGSMLKHEGGTITQAEKERFGQSKMIRYVSGIDQMIYPIAFIKNKIPMAKRSIVCSYTKEGRAPIHTELNLNQYVLKGLREKISVGHSTEYHDSKISLFATVYKGNIIKNLIMDCQSYTKYRPNETTGGIFVSWRRKEELPTGA